MFIYVYIHIQHVYVIAYLCISKLYKEIGISIDRLLFVKAWGVFVTCAALGCYILCHPTTGTGLWPNDPLDTQQLWVGSQKGCPDAAVGVVCHLRLPLDLGNDAWHQKRPNDSWHSDVPEPTESGRLVNANSRILKWSTVPYVSTYFGVYLLT